MTHQYKSAKRNLINAETLRQFSKRHLWRWLAAAALEWGIIAATMWACSALHYWWVWVAGIVVIGTRQHGLAVLAHDGTHYLVANSKRCNDLLTNYLTTYPLMMTVEGYRAEHLPHHWYLETPADPSRVTIDHNPKDWTFPMSKGHLIRMLLFDLTGISQKSSAALLKYLWQIPGGIKYHILRVVLYQVAFLTAFTVTGHLWMYILLWIVPLFTVAVTCYHIRSMAEHSGFGSQENRYKRDTVDSLVATRTTKVGALWQFLLIPYHISYHIEHHLYPSVPVFQLRALHKMLSHHPEYAANAHVTRGYRNLFRELTGYRKSDPSDVLRSETAINTSPAR